MLQVGFEANDPLRMLAFRPSSNLYHSPPLLLLNMSFLKEFQYDYNAR